MKFLPTTSATSMGRLRRTQQRALHQMVPVEEALASDLNLVAGVGWSKLHGNLSSQLLVSFNHDGRTEQLPMSVIRNLAYEPDRKLRQQAYAAELEAWKHAALPLAAALNSIKGELTVLAARRGWDSPPDAALWENSIDRQTLDAMLQSAREAFPDFRRYTPAAHAATCSATMVVSSASVPPLVNASNPNRTACTIACADACLPSCTSAASRSVPNISPCPFVASVTPSV